MANTVWRPKLSPNDGVDDCVRPYDWPLKMVMLITMDADDHRRCYDDGSAPLPMASIMVAMQMASLMMASMASLTAMPMASITRSSCWRRH
eukprot:2753303-Prymnesium_polylepis.2